MNVEVNISGSAQLNPNPLCKALAGTAGWAWRHGRWSFLSPNINHGGVNQCSPRPSFLPHNSREKIDDVIRFCARPDRTSLSEFSLLQCSFSLCGVGLPVNFCNAAPPIDSVAPLQSSSLHFTLHDASCRTTPSHQESNYPPSSL